MAGEQGRPGSRDWSERLRRLGSRRGISPDRLSRARAGAAVEPENQYDARDDVCVGDMLDRRSVAAALRDARYLVHAAADYRLWAPASEDIVHTNLEGTRILMEEAARAGVERIVYTARAMSRGTRRARCL
jgi:nucleoside-diphosphate-sugar epimerase